MKNEKTEVSLVITLLNECENIAPLLSRISDALRNIQYEVILVDDGSTDGTVREIKKYADAHVKLVKLSRNYGQSLAMAAGIQHASGTYTVTMDGDLQNDPHDIPMLIGKIKEDDFDLVAGNRKFRKDNLIIRKFPSRMANAMIRKFSGVHISDYGCSLKIFKTELAKELGLYGELHRFIPILAALQGAKISEVNVTHHARIYGESKYGLGRTFRVASDLLLLIFFQKYVMKPMHLFGTIGLFSSVAGGLINLYLLAEKLMGYDIWGRPLLVLGMIMLLGGIQLITFGFMAELMMRTYFESQQKLPYKVKEVFVGKHIPIAEETLA
jgi:glycosyltransferase involved in cell wall biosynthesis